MFCACSILQTSYSSTFLPIVFIRWRGKRQKRQPRRLQKRLLLLHLSAMPRNPTQTAKQSSLWTNRSELLYIKKQSRTSQKNTLRSLFFYFFHSPPFLLAFSLCPFRHAWLLSLFYTVNTLSSPQLSPFSSIHIQFHNYHV